MYIDRCSGTSSHIKIFHVKHFFENPCESVIERNHGTTDGQKRKHKFNYQEIDEHGNNVSSSREIIQGGNSTPLKHARTITKSIVSQAATWMK